MEKSSNYDYCLPGLQDKVAIVTGHKNGIGRATKLLLEKLGTRVVGFDLPETDLANLELIDNHIQNVLQSHDTIDVLVNNAGITNIGDVVETPLEEIESVLTVNLKLHS